MFIQGNLQLVFDALFHLGVIDPVLEMEWDQSLVEIEKGCPELESVINIVNSHSNWDLQELMDELSKLSTKSLEFLAMEVAREFADFHSREELH